MAKRFARFIVGACVLASVLAGCAKIELPPYLRPLSKETIMLLGKKGMVLASPIYIRLFKEESELELWKQREDGRFYHFKTYPICNWSGDLGPKFEQGDRQAPEGFYTIAKSQMNPHSKYHLAFNLGYPNAFDKANGRTGNFLMIHGKCKSAGCYAMTDALMEEIYAIARESFIGGQDSFQVDAFPFKMTEANMARHKSSPHYKFWRTLKEGYDYFELTRRPPQVLVCERRYIVNAETVQPVKVQPDGYCPRLRHLRPDPFVPLAGTQQAEHVVAQGPKVRVAGGAVMIDPARSGASRVVGMDAGVGLGASPGNLSLTGFDR
ncbi:MAG: L,D-transpeptidase family protein [Hyphomicrobiaceae bacterium]